MRVAPRAGAWIETGMALSSQLLPGVAPRAGAWIETATACGVHRVLAVAPRAGAWIETASVSADADGTESRPVRARGLKLDLFLGFQLDAPVAPRAGAWIETS